MTSDTSLTTLTRFVEAGGIRFAYRRWGKRGGAPVIFMQYFSGNLDDRDPRVVDSFAADYDVILFDNAGVGRSGGETPETVAEMTMHTLAFCDALGLKSFNVVGFSLGGMIAQQMALDHADRVNRIILLGTGPRGEEGMTFAELSAEERADPEQFLLAAFFSPTDASQAAGRVYLKRLAARTPTGTCPSRRGRPRRNCTQFANGGGCLRTTATPRCKISSTRASWCMAPRISWSSPSTPSSSRSICRTRSSSSTPIRATAPSTSMQSCS